MTRPADWQLDAWASMKSEDWSLVGARCPVRVTPIIGDKLSEVGSQEGAYFTLLRHLHMLTPSQIEKGLGFQRGHLSTGARIYKFARLPQISEYEYELTAKYPGGMAYPWMVKGKIYPEGDDKIHQWRLLPGVMVRVKEPIILTVGTPYILDNRFQKGS